MYVFLLNEEKKQAASLKLKRLFVFNATETQSMPQRH